MSADFSLTQPDAGRIIATLRSILHDTLGIDAIRVADFDAGTMLFGALPELDSMAVAGLLTEIEDRFAIIVDDDDIDGDVFETLGSLAAFVESKLNG